MRANGQLQGEARYGVLSHVGGLVLVLAVLGAILAIDRSGDRQKQAQLLVSQIDSRLSLTQSVPWDADPEAADLPPEEVRAALVAASREMQADLRELGQIDPRVRRLPALQRQNAAILDRQLRSVVLGDENKTNEISDEAVVVFDELRSELDAAAVRFSVSADSAKRYTLVGTAALMLALYAAFALTLAVLRRTQRKAAAQSARLLQGQKMEAVGQLAGGIAHDFNNLLVAIRGFAELARSSIAVGTPAHDDIGEAIAASDRATLLTRQLLAFSRHQVLQPVVVDPNAAVTDVVSLLDRLIGKTISIDVDLGSNVPCIEADAGQLSQVIVNLAVNARDAMSTGGKLTIRTARSDVGGSAVGGRPGPWVVITVSDNGTGIDEETQKRMFDPFYTTKHESAGTGLGLATVWGIVAQTHGHIDVESELGAGTTFTIYLPATLKSTDQAEQAVTGAATVASAATPGDGVTILLVDDNEAVRNFATRTLAGMDYTVLTAADADAALRLAAACATAIDLLITDLDMPGMSGRELAAELGHLPVLYMSGHPKELIEDGQDDTQFIQKPFGMADLRRAVSTALAEPASAGSLRVA